MPINNWNVNCSGTSAPCNSLNYEDMETALGRLVAETRERQASEPYPEYGTVVGGDVGRLEGVMVDDWSPPPIAEELTYIGSLLWQTATGEIVAIDDLERDHAMNIVNRFYSDPHIDQTLIRNIMNMVNVKDRYHRWGANKVDKKKKVNRGKRIEYKF